MSPRRRYCRPRSFWLPMDSPVDSSLSSSLSGWGLRRKIRYSHQSPSPQSKPHRTRWSADRFATAEANLVQIMRQINASIAAPVARHDLREEARKHIGDTGLLDHLLKHMAGKLVGDGKDRLRRRHNADGGLEYWLEPGDLAEIRREAGVTDSFWVPPPGWKVGDGVGCFCGEDCGEERRKIAEEVDVVKRDYQSLLQWKNKVDEDMAGMTSTLQGMKREMQLMREERRKIAKIAEACNATVLRRA